MVCINKQYSSRMDNGRTHETNAIKYTTLTKQFYNEENGQLYYFEETYKKEGNIL